ncbi:MAG: hypothetical protein ACP5US_11675, partial [Candidatus Kryptoniota bacterium]
PNVNVLSYNDHSTFFLPFRTSIHRVMPSSSTRIYPASSNPDVFHLKVLKAVRPPPHTYPEILNQLCL